jgi:hypothetical protein
MPSYFVLYLVACALFTLGFLTHAILVDGRTE